MPISFSREEILETIRMVHSEQLDIRTVTLGLSLRDCAGRDAAAVAARVREKVERVAGGLDRVAGRLAQSFGIPVINRRLAVTPVSLVLDGAEPDAFVGVARALDEAARTVGADFVGGFTALVHKGFTAGDRALVEAIPQALAATERVCASVNVASTKAGINMDAVARMGETVLEAARKTADRNFCGPARLSVFCNAPEDNPFMAGAFHGVGEPEAVLNVGVSGPGVVLRAVQQHPEADLGTLADIVKRTAFKVTRAGELVGREASRLLGIPFGIVDLSLAPTPAVGDSVAKILEAMGVERCGAPGSTAALALLNDAVKKGGAMASAHVGGLSGAFLPVSEDAGMVEAVLAGALSVEKLEAMTAVCSVGLDMIVIPGDTPAATIAGIIADEAAIGMVNDKATSVRVIPAVGHREGDWVEFGGLLGRAPVMGVSRFAAEGLIRRGGRIPAPLRALGN
ncbi:MAG: PFL family protein [Thermaerobacter sp.]|nr:PFL family protein [Thermaerobacter sp.]